MSAYIELPDFVTPSSVERAYRRSWQMQSFHRQRGTSYARAWRERGVRAATRRDPKLMKWLELAAGLLRKANDEQQARFAANERWIEYKRQDFTEFATFREALLLADEKLKAHGDCDPQVFGWVYGAAAEQVFGPL